MFSSTIIPTIGRPTLQRAVRSVLDQGLSGDDFEVIVVNDSGGPLEHQDWQESSRVRVIDTHRRERCAARNAGAAIARGDYLHFLDDDDWMAPGAFESIRALARTSPAAWLYGGYHLVDNEGKLLQEIIPNENGNCLIRFMAGEWLPLQVSFIRSEVFFEVGCFASLASLLGGDEDVDLARQISLKYEIAGTPRVIAFIRFGLEGSTTNYANLQIQSRKSREKALNAPASLSRLRNSAASRQSDLSYWQGRVVRTYLGSVLWNIGHRNYYTVVSRSVAALACFTLAGSHVVSRRFWQGAKGPHKITAWLYADPQ